MNTKQKIIAGFLATSAALFGIAHAQGPGQGAGQGCDGPGSMRSAMMSGGERGDMTKMMAQRAEQRLDALRSQLKITEQQQPLWQAYAEKTKAEMGKGMAAMRDSGETGASGTKLSAPERMEKMQSAMRDRLAAMDSVHESFKRLYASLSAEQKAVADTHFASMGMGKHGGPGSARGPGNRAPQKAPESTKG